MIHRGSRGGTPLPGLARLLVVLACVSPPAEAAAQRIRDVPPALMEQVFPEADRFQEHAGTPPVFGAWRIDPESGQESLVGYVFYTSDIPPERRGYSGPIEAVVGMDLAGRLTGVRVAAYRESIMSSMGDFLRRRGVQEQFRGKHIGDPFAPRRDVTAVSRATISTGALALGVRDAARKVALAYLAVEVDDDAPLEVALEELDWLQLRQRGVVVPMVVTGWGGVTAEINLAYMESEAFARVLVGEDALGMSQRAWESLSGSEGHVLFYGLDGPDIRLFTNTGWSIVQSGDTVAIDANAVRAFGLASGGMLDDQVVASGVMVVDGPLDVSRPFRIVYQLPSDVPPFSVEYQTESIRRAAAERAAARLEAPAPGPEVVASSEAAPADPEPVETPPIDTAPINTTPIEVDPVEPELAAPEPVEPVAEEVPPPAPLPDSVAADALAVTLEGLTKEDTESVLARTWASTDRVRLGLLLILLGVAFAAFWTKREGLRWFALAGTLGFLGFVEGGFLSVSHITSAIWVGPGVFLNDLALLALVVFTVVTTLIWGRLFCGYLCPFGVLQDILDRVVPEMWKRSLPNPLHRQALYIKYGVLALLVGAAFLGSHLSLYNYFEPFGTVFFFARSRVLWAIAGAFLVASAVVPRFYCRYACPLGAALGIGSLVAFRRIPRVEQCSHCHVCEQHCPTGAIDGDRIDFKECVRCNDCETKLIDRVGVCRHEMEDVRQRLVQVETRRPRVVS